MAINNKIYLLIAGFVVLVIISCFVGGFWILPKLQTASLELQKAKGDIDYFENSIASLTDFQQQREMFFGFFSEMDQIFVDPQAPVSFFVFLESEARDCLIDIEIIPLSLSKEDLNNFSAAFQIIAKGEAPALLMFFKRVELSPYLFEISEVNINRVLSDRSEQTSLSEYGANLNFSLKFFSQK